MTPLDNLHPTQAAVRVGIVADGAGLARVAPALRAADTFELRGQAGMPQADALPGIPWVDDRRVLLANPEVEALVLATSTRDDVALAAAAVQRGAHVWRFPPLARNFAEAVEVARLIGKQQVVYRVASWWEHVADHTWNELNWPEAFQPLLSELRVSAAGPTQASWRARSADAAGGVLAQEAYDLLEALCATRGLPESVSATIGVFHHAPATTPRETEDTAVAMLRYAGGAAVVQATWDTVPPERLLGHHGRAISARLTEDEAVLGDGAGKVFDRRPLPTEYLVAELRQFAEWVRAATHDRATACLKQHLATSALLEAAYLAARTGHPETPQKFYEVQGWPLPR